MTLDVRDISADDLEAPFRSWRPDAVFHLAAQSSVPASHADPLRDLAVNVVGTHRVTEAARGGRRCGAGLRVVGWGHLRRDPASGDRADAARAGLLLRRPQARRGGSRGGVRRAPCDRPARQRLRTGPDAGVDGAVIASFLDQAAAGGPLRIHGDGGQSRDFVHVEDAVAALVLVAQLRAIGGGDAVWNVASGTAVTIRGLADAVEAATGRTLGRLSLPRRSGDVTRSLLSPARLRSAGWQPSIGLEDGLRGLIHAVHDQEIGAG